MKYYKGDPQLPIYGAPNGYPVHKLIDVLQKPGIPPEHISTAQPLTVKRNAAFIVSVNSVEFKDLKADDLGSWKGTDTKRMYVLPSSAIWSCKGHFDKTRFKCSCTVPSNSTLLCS